MGVWFWRNPKNQNRKKNRLKKSNKPKTWLPFEIGDTNFNLAFSLIEARNHIVDLVLVPEKRLSEFNEFVNKNKTIFHKYDKQDKREGVCGYLWTADVVVSDDVEDICLGFKKNGKIFTLKEFDKNFGTIKHSILF